jgi:hypothetical protein
MRVFRWSLGLQKFEEWVDCSLFCWGLDRWRGKYGSVEVIKSNHSAVLISNYSSSPIEDTSSLWLATVRIRKLIYVLTPSFGGEDVQGFDDSDVRQGYSSESLVAARDTIKFSASKDSAIHCRVMLMRDPR